jgi:hypothetical protein
MEKIGDLKRVDLRKLWPNEATDFTKWLAKEVNIERINEVVGLTLINVRSEVSVGGYKADIFCEDATTGEQVVIENQLTKTDHTHLGQIITYASGLDAKYIIWIVKSARDEHKSAIEWLNNYTNKDIHFFLIEVQVWQINDSSPAVKMAVLEQPNDWNKLIKSNSKDKQATDRQLLVKDFWETLNEVLDERGSFNPRKPSTDHWYSLPIGTAQCHLSIAVLSKKKKIRLEVHIPDNKELFDHFAKNKDQIEKMFGEKLNWDRLNNKKAARIEKYITGFNLYETDTHKEFATKSIEIIEKLKCAFEPYIR